MKWNITVIVAPVTSSGRSITCAFKSGRLLQLAHTVHGIVTLSITLVISLPAAEGLPTLVTAARLVLGVPVKVS